MYLYKIFLVEINYNYQTNILSPEKGYFFLNNLKCNEAYSLASNVALSYLNM